MLQCYKYIRELCENDSWNELRGEAFEVSKLEESIFNLKVAGNAVCAFLKETSLPVYFVFSSSGIATLHRPSA